MERFELLNNTTTLTSEVSQTCVEQVTGDMNTQTAFNLPPLHEFHILDHMWTTGWCIIKTCPLKVKNGQKEAFSFLSSLHPNHNYLYCNCSKATSSPERMVWLNLKKNYTKM